MQLTSGYFSDYIGHVCVDGYDVCFVVIISIRVDTLAPRVDSVCYLATSVVRMRLCRGCVQQINMILVVYPFRRTVGISFDPDSSDVHTVSYLVYCLALGGHAVHR